MLFLSDINWLFLAVMATLLAAPYMVAKITLLTAQAASSRLQTGQIARFCCLWAMTAIASISLMVLQLHEFSVFSLILYFIIAVFVIGVTLCMMLVAFTDP